MKSGIAARSSYRARLRATGTDHRHMAQTNANQQMQILEQTINLTLVTLLISPDLHAFIFHILCLENFRRQNILA